MSITAMCIYVLLTIMCKILNCSWLDPNIITSDQTCIYMDTWYQEKYLYSFWFTAGYGQIFGLKGPNNSESPDLPQKCSKNKTRCKHTENLYYGTVYLINTIIRAHCRSVLLTIMCKILIWSSLTQKQPNHQMTGHAYRGHICSYLSLI